MKIREKKYLFEGFLNVLMIVLISLATGYVMGTMGAHEYCLMYLTQYGISR